MNNISSLYELIKQKSQEKGRKLKIIVDWDECLFAREPYGHYLFFQELTNKKPPFIDFFKELWEKAEFCYAKNQEHLSFVKNSGIVEIEEANRKNSPAQNWEEAAKKSRAVEIMRSKRDFYEETNFLTFSEDLQKSLKENDLVADLIIPQNYHAGRKGFIPSSGDDTVSCPRKRWKNAKTFGKFPNARIEINKPITFADGEEKKLTRAEWTKNNHPDFDIFIDDNTATLEELVDFYPDKIFVVPDYAMNKKIQGDNVYRFPVQPIDLQDQDFAIAALEMKTKQLEQELKTTKQERERESKNIYELLG